jgi:hypothetical protein
VPAASGLERRRPAHAVADQNRTIEPAELVDEPQDVVCEPSMVQALLLPVALAVAAQVDGDD